LFYKDNKGNIFQNGTMNGIFLSDKDSKDNYPFGDSPILRFALNNSLNLMYGLDYSYTSFYGFKFSVTPNKNYSMNDLASVSKADMFSASLSLNTYQGKSSSQVEKDQKWFFTIQYPGINPVTFIPIKQFQISTNDDGSTVFNKLDNNGNKTNEFIACLSPELPFFMGVYVNKSQENGNSSSWAYGNIQTTRQYIARNACLNYSYYGNEIPECSKNSTTSTQGTVSIRIPNYYSSLPPFNYNGYDLNIPFSDFIYSTNSSDNYQFTVVNLDREVGYE
jgi:hypothetical protein